MQKKILGIAVAIIMMLGVVGLAACDLGDEETYAGNATDRAIMLAAFEEIKGINSYTETTHTVIFTNEVLSVDHKNVIKYQIKESNLIAEGYSMLNNEVVSYIYIENNYKYVRSAFAETGVKFSSENKAISDSESEPIEFLSEEFMQIVSEFTIKKTKSNTTIYSFKHIEDAVKVADYKIITETSTNKLVEFRTDWYNTADLSTKTTCAVSYDYTPVTVTLPDNLDLYAEVSL